MNNGMKEFSFLWFIENYSYCGLISDEALYSPNFTPVGLNGTSWVLSLDPRRLRYALLDYIALKRSSHDAGPENFKLKLQISVMKEDGSTLFSKECEHTFGKGGELSFSPFPDIHRVYVRLNTDYPTGDTVGVHCRMWVRGESVRMVRHCTARTRIGIEKISFLHKVENFSALKLGETRNLQVPSHSETGCAFTSTLCLKDTSRNEKAVVVEISPSRTEYKLRKMKLSLINASGNIIECYKYDFPFPDIPWSHSLSKQFILDKREEYLPNDELSLLCESTFYTGVDHGKIEEILYDIPVAAYEQRYCIPHNTSNIYGIYNQLTNKDPHRKRYNATEKLSICPSALDDFKALYRDKLLTDVVLKTATKSFPTHKNVLCARSSVFKAMLTNGMKEKNSECIKVEDLENETVQRLLIFLYSDNLEELQWESAIQLYYAADKYAIERLKVLCSSFLADNLSTSNASELLLLAETHNDVDLKKLVEDFIWKHEEEVFCSVEWEKLNGTNPHLVLKTMQLKYKREKGTDIRKQKTKNNSNKIKYNAAEKLTKCPSALDDFKVLYSDQLFTDVLLKTAKKSFPTHKNVLCARSSVFRAMLTNDMKEKNSDCIKVEDLENETVQRLLLFLYSDSHEELQWESAVQLYYAADKYAIDKLKVLCSSFLVDNLSTHNASELLLLADTHNHTELKQVVEDFICEHDEEVFCSDEWDILSERNPQLFMRTIQLKYKRKKEGK